MLTGTNRHSTQHSYLLNFYLSAIDYMRTGPLVMSRKTSDVCGLFLKVTFVILKAIHDNILKIVATHSA